MDLGEAVRRLIRQERLIEAGETVLVAVSGGIDSSTLLFLLKELSGDLGFGLAVAHVNHGLRGDESDGDEDFVRQTAGRYGVPCHTARFDVKGHAVRKGLSLQHAGRELRYGYFDRVARENGYARIALGHNRDDQVETFLLRVVKGTGLSGLASIPLKRGMIVRPLLLTYRSEIDAYARAHSLAHREDSSNGKETYERNFVRKRIVPLMEEINPRFREKVLLLLSDITAVDRIFDGEAAGVVSEKARPCGEGFGIGVEELLGLTGEVRFRVLARLLSAVEPAFTPLREHVRLIEKSLLSRRPNNGVVLPMGLSAKRVYGDILFARQKQEAASSGAYPVSEGANDLPDLGLSLHVSFSEGKPRELKADANRAVFDARLIGRLSVRTFRNGDRFTPLGMKEATKVKNFFISRKVPADVRRRVPFLLSDGEIVWVVGMRISETHKVTPGTERVMEVRADFSRPPLTGSCI